jgi:hypothetical protein
MSSQKNCVLSDRFGPIPSLNRTVNRDGSQLTVRLIVRFTVDRTVQTRNWAFVDAKIRFLDSNKACVLKRKVAGCNNIFPTILNVYRFFDVENSNLILGFFWFWLQENGENQLWLVLSRLVEFVVSLAVVLPFHCVQFVLLTSKYSKSQYSRVPLTHVTNESMWGCSQSGHVISASCLVIEFAHCDHNMN